MFQVASRFLPVLTLSALLAGSVQSADLRDAVPGDVFTATWYTHNPERDYQSQYHEEVWQTIEGTRIIPRFIDAVRNQIPEHELEEIEGAFDQLSQAIEPADLAAIKDCTESVYAQKMDIPNSQHLVLLRLPSGVADGYVKAATNLIELAAENSDGEIDLETETFSGATLHSLVLPPQAPFGLCVGSMDDIFIFASTADFAKDAIRHLNNSSLDSKFDDPRLKDALTHLPEPEDGLTFFDGAEFFEQMHEIPSFIRQVSQGNPDAENVANFAESILNEVDSLDYEVTVEYTEGYQNRSAVFGRVKAGNEDALLGKMFASQQPFSNWNRWVPANASGFSLSMGANLHPAYVFLMELIPRHFPEAQEGLDQFAQIQDQLDIHLDEDILQAFPGPSVSISMPGGAPNPLGGASGQSVSFIKCEKPERIKELLHRLVEALQEIPQIQQQGLALQEVEGLEGFEKISVTILTMGGVQPVIGFRDGWMIIGSSADAVESALDTKNSSGETFVDTDEFKSYGLDIDGPVVSIGYTDLAAQTRSMAQGIQQMGMMLPMITAMAAQQGADTAALQEFLALVPSIGQIIGKLDFYESQLSVTRPGPDELSYTRDTIIKIRPAK